MKALDKWRADAASIRANGWRIAMWSTTAQDPERPWLLLIHGFPTSSWDWSAIWPDLEARFNLAAIDMLGFGLSEKPRGVKFRIVDQADLQEMALEQLGVGDAHIFAHDYGVSVAQELLARHNENTLSFSIKSLCFLNGGLYPELHRPLLVQKLAVSPIGPAIGALLTKASLRRSFDQIFGPETKASDEEIDGHWTLFSEHGGRRVFHKLLDYIPQRRENRTRWVGALESSRTPLALINGGADPISGAHLYEHFSAALPTAYARLLPDIGYYPHTEAPDRVLEAYFDFVETIEPRSVSAT
ncbi:MAG: alpha/beta hydrolase [Pseudomonadota bacterium]